MILKWIFDRLVSFIGLLFLWPVLLITAILVKIKNARWACILRTEEGWQGWAVV
jgi:lipopolysaccharide/colanic/teichoic acid biosynthesis glycosyltransferase